MSFRWIRGVCMIALVFCGVIHSAWGAVQFRLIDGSGNNLSNPDWGQAGTALSRLTTPAYADGLSVPRGGLNPSSLPSPRAISNTIAAQSGSITNGVHATDWVWQWGQFLDHDLDLTPPASPAQPFNIPVPASDLFFPPNSEIAFSRSESTDDSGGVRQQTNEITAYIDASNIYGSDPTRADALRTMAGDGKLVASLADDGSKLLMRNTPQLPNDPNSSDSFFLSGDARANEQIGLTATHSLFMREHNRLADVIAQQLTTNQALIDEFNNSGLSRGDFIYQSARKIVGAQLQHITYEEFLPILLGGKLNPFAGYDDTVNASVSNEFSTAAYRVGHTMLSPEIQRINNDGSHAGAVALQDAFFNPSLVQSDGVDSILKGLASQLAQEVDTQVVDDVRNFLFGLPGAGGMDLPSANLQRGRDHGLPSLNDFRGDAGLGRYGSFLELAGGDVELANRFASIYGSIDDVDLWIGGLAEVHIHSGMLGETFGLIIRDQFGRTRDGDRFFYLNPSELEFIESIAPGFLRDTTLSDIIRRNSSISNIQDDAFRLQAVPEPSAYATFFLVALGSAYLVRRRRRQT